MNKSKHIEATDQNALTPEFVTDLEKVYNEHYLAIYRFVYHRIERKEDAADIVSSAFMKAMKNADKFENRHENALKSWIFRIASNEVLLYYRKKKVERKYFVEEKYLQSITEEMEDEKPEMQLMLESLQNIPQADYELIQMKHFDGMSFRDMAEILDKSEESLRVSLHRIRKKLYRATVELSKRKGIEIMLALAVLLMAL